MRLFVSDVFKIYWKVQKVLSRGNMTAVHFFVSSTTRPVTEGQCTLEADCGSTDAQDRRIRESRGKK